MSAGRANGEVTDSTCIVGRAGRGEELESSLRSLILEVVQEEGGGLPLLVRAAQEPAGHLLVLWLVRTAELLPQAWLLILARNPNFRMRGASVMQTDFTFKPA